MIDYQGQMVMDFGSPQKGPENKPGDRRDYRKNEGHTLPESLHGHQEWL